jgi:hypothetical protein
MSVQPEVIHEYTAEYQQIGKCNPKANKMIQNVNKYENLGYTPYFLAGHPSFHMMIHNQNIQTLQGILPQCVSCPFPPKERGDGVKAIPEFSENLPSHLVTVIYQYWLVVGNILYFSIYWE